VGQLTYYGISILLKIEASGFLVYYGLWGPRCLLAAPFHVTYDLLHVLKEL